MISSVGLVSIGARVQKLYDDLPTIGKEQFPYGLSVGINKTLMDIQAAQRRGIQQRFTLRRPSFVLGMVRIRKEDFATKVNLNGRVRVGEYTADFESNAKQTFGASLVRHEEGGVFHEGYWIPTAALRPSFGALVPRPMLPWALSLWRTDRQMAAGTMGGARIQGNRRTFSLFNRQGELIGIFQRYGLRLKEIRRRVKKGNAPTLAERQDEGIRMIWARVPSIRLQPRLGFADTARIVTRTRIMPNIQEGLVKALRTAKPR